MLELGDILEVLHAGELDDILEVLHTRAGRYTGSTSC